MTRSELVYRIAERLDFHSEKEKQSVELAFSAIIAQISDKLATRGTVEIRGFGTFFCSLRAPQAARNPKTGTILHLSERHLPRFRPAQTLRDRIDR